MSPDEYCQDKAASSGSSFYHTFVFLPQGQRRAITALYAFCREVDDVVDNMREPGVAQAKLDWWHGEVDAIFNGNPQHPVARALAAVRDDAALHAEYLHEIVDGMQMDLNSHQYASFSDLKLYCWRVAGVVGLLSAGIFGYSERATERYAQELGIAFQLTNILRDVREDARRGRIYLPVEDCERHGVTAADFEADATGEALRALLREYAGRARAYYQSAHAALPDADRYRQRVGLMMSAIYQRLLAQMEHRDFRVLEQRPRLHPLHKLWIAWRTGVAEERRERRRSAQ